MVGGVLSANGVAEYIGETAFGTFPTNPAMVWIGVIKSFKWKVVTVEEVMRGLRAASSALRQLPTGKFKAGEEMVVVDLEYWLQDFAFFKYAFSNTGGTAQTNDLKSLSFGLIEPENSKYAKIVGGVIKSHSVECERNKGATGKATVWCADIVRTTNDPWSSTDYKGTGTHATEVTTAAKAFKDITSLQWNSAAFKDACNKFKIAVDNELTVVPGVDSTLNTKIDSIVPGARNISFEGNFNLDGVDADADTLAGTAANLVLNWGGAGSILTFAGATFPEFENEFKHGAALARTMKAENCTDLNFS